MSSNRNKWLLNSIITLALLTLLITGYITWSRIQSQSAYEKLSEIRSTSKPSDIEGVTTTINPPDLLSPSEYNEEVPTVTYTYEPNESSEWLDKNKDYMGWITIPGTIIDYPYVRSQDNKDYLTIDFNGKTSDAGTLFLDYRNLGNFNDQHTVLYGHFMKNKSMFHNLIYYYKEEFFKENQTIELSGLYETKTYKIFSVYEVSADDYILSLDFDTSKTYQDYLASLVSLSVHPPTFELDASKGLLTLVTCSYGVGNGRTIVHAIEQ